MTCFVSALLRTSTTTRNWQSVITIINNTRKAYYRSKLSAVYGITLCMPLTTKSNVKLKMVSADAVECICILECVAACSCTSIFFIFNEGNTVLWNNTNDCWIWWPYTKCVIVWQALLPTTISATVCNYVEDGDSVTATVRLPLANEEQMMAWLDDYQRETKTTIRKSRTNIK